MVQLPRPKAGLGGLGTIRRRGVALAFALMAVGFFMGLTGAAWALTVEVEGTTYELSVFAGSYDDNSATLQSQVWWGDASLAESFRDAAFEAQPSGDRTINNGGSNNYAYSTSGTNVNYYAINGSSASGSSSRLPTSLSLYYVTATEVAPVPEINAGSLSQAMLILLAAWLVARYRAHITVPQRDNRLA